MTASVSASKLLIVIGITGRQGSSVANAFLELPDWRIRGVSRDTSSPAAQDWISKGVEIVKGDLNDVNSLENAFRGATAIFGVIDFYSQAANPVSIAGAQEAGITINEYARNIETNLAMNIAIAASSPAVSATLTHFVFSSLSDTKRWSRGKYTWNFHFDGKADAVNRIKAEMPDLAAKLSIVQVGAYTSNWKWGLGRPQKLADGSFVVQIPDAGEIKIPWTFVERDTGVYVKALLENAPGKNILAFSETATHREFWTLWADTRNVKLDIQESSVEELVKPLPHFLRRQFQESMMYVAEFGYTGGDPDVRYTLQDLSPGAKTTTLKEYMEVEDWSSLV
ncbi:hypothetical protein AU210_009931 [Fusarium oxysporum f. sp. radicis-cucumerinum]|uniref:NmrA-like domain-containing protein n=1 Tax=Fusarium oxysporum f. sp. radicis-cucumerinum TaxID=327505 RepID=A0A2H3H799_FUSOX|nr:hypothetical protein AU210_009931 [Fusarium oxysporum f. sp. radicis-cucumerinum]